MNHPLCLEKKNPIEENNTFVDGFPKVSSITFDELTAIADEIFGIGKWSHEVKSQTIDYVDYVMGKYQIGAATFVRVELSDKTYHQEMGYSIMESPVKGVAVYSARAESIVNGLKKTLLCFGNVIQQEIMKYTSNSDSQNIQNSDCVKSQAKKKSSPGKTPDEISRKRKCKRKSKQKQREKQEEYRRRMMIQKQQNVESKVIP